ncbi:hypothetical protein ABPG75_002338 [Micractinium tetrahymenae]
MLLVEDVLAAAQQARSAENAACGTPLSAEHALPIKRQRVMDTEGSDCSTQQQWAAPPSQEQQPVCAAPQQQDPAVPWHASYLLDYVHRCLEALVGMHPVCSFIITDTKAAEMGCAIFRRVYLQHCPPQRCAIMRERFLAQALLAASLWVAVKWEATRTTTPDSAIMSRITGIPSAFLRQQEREILAVLRWELMGLAQEVGAVGMTDLSDGPALDQQAQLAALAQPPVLRWLAAAEAPAAPAPPSLEELLKASSCRASLPSDVLAGNALAPGTV